MAEVRHFFDDKHKQVGGGRLLWRIINLCAEKDRWYDTDLFGGDNHARRFGFHDHNPCPLALLPQACGDPPRERLLVDRFVLRAR